MVQNRDQHRTGCNTQLWPLAPDSHEHTVCWGSELLCNPVGPVDPWPGQEEVRIMRLGWSDHKNRGKASSETRLVKPPGAETRKDQRTELVPLYESK